MAKVDFFRATDMSALPSSPSSASGIGTSFDEVDIDFSDGHHFGFIAPFDPGSNTRTITHAFIDTPDDNDIPNLFISGLSFTAPIDFYNQVVSNAALFISDLLSGPDSLIGTSGSDTILGFGGNDVLNGGLGADNMRGGMADDWYFVDNAGDTIIELAGEGTLDRVFASASYNLTPGAAVEIMSTTNHAGTDAINLRGNEFANTIFGNAGMNFISGGFGNDTLMGLGGNDYFLFEKTPGVGNVDQVGDFTPGQDHMLLVQSVFTSLSIGLLSDANFLVRGTAFQDANDFIVYDQSTGALSYDPDGSGAGAAAPFANVTAGLALHSSDFQIV